MNGTTAKPSTTLRIGDRVEARINQRERVLEVTGLIAKRVGAQLAADHYIDFSPPPPPRVDATPVFQRDKGAGRPTKRDRRQLDRLRGRDGRR